MSARRLHLTIAGADTLVTSPLCASCPSGKAGCCAAPPAVAWADLGRIVSHGGASFLLDAIRTGHLRPCARGLAITRTEGPHGLACVYLGERGCVLRPEQRSVTCNEYLCEDALADAANAGDPAAARARNAHVKLERALAEWDRRIADEIGSHEGADWDMPFLLRLGALFEAVRRRDLEDRS